MLRISIELNCCSEAQLYFQVVLPMIEDTSEPHISEVVPTPPINLEHDMAILRDQRWAETWQDWIYD